MGTPGHFSLLSPARVLFWLVAVATLVNANHFLNLTIGTGWQATLGLAICCIFLCLVVPPPWRTILGLPGVLISTALISYLLICLGTAVVIVAAWAGVDPVFPLRIGLAILTVVATALGGFVVLQQIGVERLLKGVLAILALVCLLVLATPLLGEYLYVFPRHLYDLKWIQSGRFTGTFADPNPAAVVCCYAVVLAFAFLGNGRHRTVASLVLLLGSTATILTFSRAGLVTLTIIFILFLRFSISRFRQKHAFFVRSAVAFVTGIAILAAVNQDYFLLTKVQTMRLLWFLDIFRISDALPDVRLQLADIALWEIMESPFWGHGLLRFHYLEDAPVCRLRFVCGSHNVYLMLWGEAGIIPLTLFLLAIGALLRTSLALSEPLVASVVAGWTVVFVLACLTADGNLYFAWNNFIFGLSCVLVAQAQRESRGRRLAARPTFAPTNPVDQASPATG